MLHTKTDTNEEAAEMFTQLPESWHQVNKRGHAQAALLRQVSFKVVAQGEQVVGQVHAVVVLDGCQVRELKQILPGQRHTASLNKKNLRRDGEGGLHLDLIIAALRSTSLLVVRWDDIIEELEHVPHSEEELRRTEKKRVRERFFLLSVTK